MQVILILSATGAPWLP